MINYFTCYPHGVVSKTEINTLGKGEKSIRNNGRLQSLIDSFPSFQYCLFYCFAWHGKLGADSIAIVESD